VARTLLRRAVDETLRAEGRAPRTVEVSIALVDDAAITALNSQYRGQPGPTDVLAFAQDDTPAAPGVPVLLGDIVIALDTAAAQAASHRRTLDEEVCWLAIHGTLHLLGYDDATAEGFAEMVRKGTRIWERLFPDAAPPTHGA